MASTPVFVPRPSDSAPPKKVIIDTDPGIDDSMAILLAFNSPELEVIGLTTIFGNVRTPQATNNALHLCELAGRADIPVAQGELTTLKGVEKVRVADFVHGDDGLGNTNQPPPKGSAIAQSGPQFMVDKANERPGEVTIIALGPLTNVAKAIELDPTFPQKVAQIVILGGAFFVNGNVNPAAEANVFGDPDAADRVFTCGADIIAVGINITHQIILTEEDLEHLRDSPGRHGKYLHRACQFYLAYHKAAYEMDAIYLHDPATVVAVFRPDLFTYQQGSVRVQSNGISKGVALVSNTTKVWAEETPWCNHPPIKVATTVQATEVAAIVKHRLMEA